MPAIFNLRERSLTRGNILVLGSLAASVPLSGFPGLHANPLLAVPALLTLAGTADTLRCIRRRWSFYHGGVIMCLYMDLMAIFIVWFFLLYPYFVPISATR